MVLYWVHLTLHYAHRKLRLCRAQAGDQVGNKRGNKKQFLPHFNYCVVSAAAVWEGETVGVSKVFVPSPLNIQCKEEVRGRASLSFQSFTDFV